MRDEVLAAILAANKELSRDEPEVEANIGVQMAHMGLESWSISVRRRLRDAIAKIDPDSIVFAGAGIGHLSAWVLDHLSEVNSKAEVQLIEDGNRFAVILKRLCDRYSSVSTSIVVGSPHLLSSELNAWKISKSGDPPMLPKSDVVVVNAPLSKLSEDINSMLGILSKNGVLFTVEPTPPVGEKEEDDPEVQGFNNWMELIKTTNETHHIAFAPLFGGTIVAWLQK